MTAAELLEAAVDAVFRASGRGRSWRSSCWGPASRSGASRRVGDAGSGCSCSRGSCCRSRPRAGSACSTLANALVAPPHSRAEDPPDAFPTRARSASVPEASRGPAGGPRTFGRPAMTVRDPGGGLGAGRGRARRLAPRVPGDAPRRIVVSFRLRSLLRRCRSLPPGPALEMLEACREEVGIRRRVGLLVSTGRTAPGLTGLWRPRIIVSGRILEALGGEQRRWLFRHELAHRPPPRRGHAVPLVVGVRPPLVQPRRCGCGPPSLRPRGDVEARLRRGTSSRGRPAPQRVGYGKALLRVAEVLRGSDADLGAVAFLLRKPELVRRIAMIADDRGRSRGWALVAAALLIGLAGAGLTDAVSGPWRPARAEDPEAPTPRAAEARSALPPKGQGRTIRIRVLGPARRAAGGGQGLFQRHDDRAQDRQPRQLL